MSSPIEDLFFGELAPHISYGKLLNKNTRCREAEQAIHKELKKNTQTCTQTI